MVPRRSARTAAAKAAAMIVTESPNQAIIIPSPASQRNTKARVARTTAAAGGLKTTVTRPGRAPTLASKEDLPIIPFPSAAEFEAHLDAYPIENPTGLWLKISKKASGIPSVSYDEAIDVALCYGWIDGQRKLFDELYFLQRFTPRRKNSLWSRRNVDKVSTLTAAGRMREGGQLEIDKAKKDGRWDRAYEGSSSMKPPPDFEKELSRKGNEAARDRWETLNKSQRYPFCFKIETAKRPETRRRKIVQLVEMLAGDKFP